jgi:hypothetical protein
LLVESSLSDAELWVGLEDFDAVALEELQQLPLQLALAVLQGYRPLLLLSLGVVGAQASVWGAAAPAAFDEA